MVITAARAADADVDSNRTRRIISQAKCFATDTGWEIVNDCLQDSDPDTVWVRMPEPDDDTTDDDTTDDDADPDDDADDDAAPSGGEEEEELPGLFGTGGCGSL